MTRIAAVSALKRALPAPLKKLLKIALHPSRAVVLPFPPTYDRDGLATIHNCDFIEEPRFKRAYALGEQTGSWVGIEWRAHVYSWLAQQAFRLEGDFVECGVNRGGYARMVFDYLDFGNSAKTFYLLDTFRGFDLQQIQPDELSRGVVAAYNYEECFDEVQKTFRPFRNAVLVRGAVPDTLPQVRAEKVAFLSIDMNCVEPEIAAAEFFWDRMVSQGVMLLDDYGHPLHVAQKRAFDQFAQRVGVSILHLPTEQGVILKP